MRRADEEPERPAGGGPRSAGRHTAGRLLVPLVVAGAAVVVLSTAAEGRAHVAPFGTGARKPPGATPPPDQPSVATTLPPPGDLGPTVDSALQTVLLVLACIVAAVVAALLIRLLVSAIRARRRTGRGRLRAAGEGTEPEVADAPAVLRGIAAALVALEEHREPGDAVVQAWLGLQQAAEDAGFARSRAETPTEFTGRVLSRTGADRAPLRRLLRLYLRARFGDDAITPDDATAARDALRALEASWEREPAVSRE